MSTDDYRALCVELLEALENAIRVIYHEDGTRHISTADAVIAKADAALAQPEPEGPTDEELEEAPFLYAPEWYNNEMAAAWEAGRNSGWRDALARWGRPAITPIPVSERLPGPEDCNAEGRLYAVYKGRLFEIDLPCILEWGFTHWLPAHVLPLPLPHQSVTRD